MDLAGALLKLAPSDLKSLLLHVFAEQAGDITPSAVLGRHETLRATKPSYADGRSIHRVEGHAFAAAGPFEMLDLSPVVPQGTQRALGGTHPNNIVSTIRGVEISGDPTTALALEAARRRRGDRATAVRLGTLQRVRRRLPIPPPLLPHFKLLALITAGRSADLMTALREHLTAHLEMTARLRADGFAIDGCVAELSDPESVIYLLGLAGLPFESIRGKVVAHQFGGSEPFLRSRGITLPRGPLADLDVSMLPRPHRERLARLSAEVLEPVAAAFPWVKLGLDLARLEGLGYYTGPTLRLTWTNTRGQSFPIADGGVLAWTAKLLGDAGERLVASGMGIDIIPAMFLDHA